MMNNDVGAAESKIQPFNFIHVGDIYDEPEEEVSYCVEGLLPSASLSLIAGKPKAGKSTIARQLAVCVAQGTQFLGRTTQQGTVLYLALEEKRSEVMAHFKLLGLAKEDPLHIHCGAVNKHDAVAMLKASLEAIGDVALVIVDPIFKFVGVRDCSDYVQVSDGLEKLMEVARNSEITILAVHHLKKKESDDSTDGALGSTAIVGAVDTFLALKRQTGGDVRTLSSEQRYGTSLQPTQLQWNEGTRELTMGLGCAEVQELASQRTRDRILVGMVGYVENHPGSTQEELLRTVTGNATTKKSTMRSLIDTGRFEQVGAGTKGDPYRYSLSAVVPEVPCLIEEVLTH
jgi:archaellum biogenesis ATPase FlaH